MLCRGFDSLLVHFFIFFVHTIIIIFNDIIARVTKRDLVLIIIISKHDWHKSENCTDICSIHLRAKKS